MIHISKSPKQNAYLAPMLVAIFLVAPSGSAFALSDDDPCSNELKAVKTAIQEGTFVGRNADSDKSNLETKLSAADAKILRDKYSDAIDKLLEISDKATDLATAKKLDAEDASTINMKVDEAISCVGGL